jgi:Uma2 family endonuclease
MIVHMSEAIAWVSLDDFVTSEERSERRHELVGGRLYLMAGGSERHDLAAGLLYEFVASPARAAKCRPFMANRIVHTRRDAAYNPDVMVVCGPAAHRLYETDPTLVIEVLSPSTADTDRREKALAYAASPTLRHLLLVDPDKRRIEVAQRTGADLTWKAYGPSDVIVTGYGPIDLDAFYDQLDSIATTR